MSRHSRFLEKKKNPSHQRAKMKFKNIKTKKIIEVHKRLPMVINFMFQSSQYVCLDDEFEESKHPRDNDGKFASSGGSKSQQSTLEMMKKEVPESIENEIFGKTGYIYYTPYRPIENSQEKMLGSKITPIHERVFTSDKPLTSKQLNDIEAMPISTEAVHKFAKELADSGVAGMMSKDGQRFSFIHESTKSTGKTQITYYDKNGAIKDSQHKDTADAIQELIEGGYIKILPEQKIGSLIQKVMVK